MHYLFYAGTAIFLWATLATLASKLSHVPPFLLLGVTLCLGGVLSFNKRRFWQLDWKLLSFGIVGIFGYHFLLFMALRIAPAVEANVINYLWPLFIVLLAPLYLKGYQLNKAHIAGGLLGFSGVYLLVAGPNALALSSESITGYLLALLAAFVWSSYSLLSKRLSSLNTATIGLFFKWCNFTCYARFS